MSNQQRNGRRGQSAVADGVRGLLVGASAGTSMVVARKVLAHHPRAAKAGLVAAILGTIIAATPAEKRPQVVKAMAVVAALIVGLVVLLVFVVVMLGVTAPLPPTTPQIPVTEAVPGALVPMHVSSPYWYHGT